MLPEHIEALSTGLCQPWITVAQFHGAILPCILLGILWILAGYARLRELRRLQNLAKKRSFNSKIPGDRPSIATKLAKEEVRVLSAAPVIFIHIQFYT